ncbi:MAG TPA: sarcosine oxidase subunit gamma family protein [Steroidobacteraceae bacterium]|nr:sarcosine oxidase subunit gamma family protein [Steroidobacteraceae bacterium]
MSAPEVAAGATGVGLGRLSAEVIEIAAFRERTPELEELAAARGVRLAGLGRINAGSARLTLAVRPGRWLLLGPPAAPGASLRAWQQALAGRGAAVDLSAGLAALLLGGRDVREMLARGCRLDLHPAAFPAGSAAATIMAQVPVVLAVLTSRILLLTPATTARHLTEWLVSTARPFGLASRAETAVHELFGVEST